MLISDVLREKGNNVYTISPEESVYKAISELRDKHIGALVVINGDENVVGMLSERDYTSKVILEGRSSKDTLVKEIMSPKVQFVTPSQSVEECMALMTEKRFRHFPVLNDRHMVGIVSIGDLVKAIISKQKIEIDYLMNYITGKYPV
jgi:CBS domain-containing protein